MPETFVFTDSVLHADGTCQLQYQIGNKQVCETFEFPVSDQLSVAAWEVAGRLVQLLHLVAGVSYLKAWPSATVQLPAGLTEPVSDLVVATYRHGLAEHCHTNSLPYIIAETAGSPQHMPPSTAELPSGTLVANGAGKDSIVALELTRRATSGESFALVTVNPTQVHHNIAGRADLPLVTVKRQLDPQVREWNAAGRPNGHVPITAIVMVATMVAAVLSGRTTVVFANERSADEPTLHDAQGQPVNHQWSKSSQSEKLLQTALTSIHPELRCVSVLRPMRSVTVSRLAATLCEYHDVFCSCNAAFGAETGGTRVWCGNCAKCRWVSLALAPHLPPDALKSAVGHQLLDDLSQLSGFEALLGLEGHTKPFECVGEVHEAHASMRAAAAGEYRTMAVPAALRSKLHPVDLRSLEGLHQDALGRLPPRFAAAVQQVTAEGW